MNSVFTNALPGQKEDDFIYTLKERFNQSIEDNPGNNNKINNNNNNNRGNIQGYENNHNEKQMFPEFQQRDNYKDYNDQNSIHDYSNSYYYNHSRSRSKSINRDRDRSRNRSREKYQRDNQKSRSRSSRRNYQRSRSRNDEFKRRIEDDERDDNNINRNYPRHYSSFSYAENGVTKINIYFTVPDHLVSLLIGKKGENVRAIMNSTGAVVTFCKEVSNYYFYLYFFFIV